MKFKADDGSEWEQVVDMALAQNGVTIHRNDYSVIRKIQAEPTMPEIRPGDVINTERGEWIVFHVGTVPEDKDRYDIHFASTADGSHNAWYRHQFEKRVGSYIKRDGKTIWTRK